MQSKSTDESFNLIHLIPGFSVRHLPDLYFYFSLVSQIVSVLVLIIIYLGITLFTFIFCCCECCASSAMDSFLLASVTLVTWLGKLPIHSLQDSLHSLATPGLRFERRLEGHSTTTDPFACAILQAFIFSSSRLRNLPEIPSVRNSNKSLETIFLHVSQTYLENSILHLLRMGLLILLKLSVHVKVVLCFDIGDHLSS